MEIIKFGSSSFFRSVKIHVIILITFRPTVAQANGSRAHRPWKWHIVRQTSLSHRVHRQMVDESFRFFFFAGSASAAELNLILFVGGDGDGGGRECVHYYDWQTLTRRRWLSTQTANVQVWSIHFWMRLKRLSPPQAKPYGIHRRQVQIAPKHSSI